MLPVNIHCVYFSHDFNYHLYVPGLNFKRVFLRPSSVCSSLLDSLSFIPMPLAVTGNVPPHLASSLERTWPMVMPWLDMCFKTFLWQECWTAIWNVNQTVGASRSTFWQMWMRKTVSWMKKTDIWGQMRWNQWKARSTMTWLLTTELR